MPAASDASPATTTRWALVAMALATFASAVAMVTIAVAVPGLSREWRLGQHEVQWVASGFMLAMLPAMMVTPALLARWGLRTVALFALAALVAGGVAGAVATNFGVLLTARVLEGLAAGVLQPLPLLVVARHVEPAHRGRAMGQVMLGVVLAPALAPALAGWLADQIGWRAVLLTATPMALMAMAAAARVLPRDPSPAATASPARGGHLRWHLFSIAPFRRACGVAFFYGMAAFAANYLAPVFMQLGLGHSATVAGLALFPGGLVLAIASPWGGRFADRRTRHRVIAVGMAVMGLAHLPIVALGPQQSLLWFVALMMIARIGMALALPSLALDALRTLPAADWPAASALVSLTRQLGAGLGIAAAAAVVEWRWAREGAALPAFHQGFVLVALLCLAGAWLAWRNVDSTA